MIELLKKEALWFPSAVMIAFVVVTILVVRYRRQGVARRATITRALNVFYGCVIGIMGSGHLLVVTIKALEGTLSYGIRWFLYPLGLVLAVPAWLLVASSIPRRMMLFNTWLAVALIAQGASAPLAIPAILNLVYLRVTAPWIGRAIIAISIVLYSMLFGFGIAFSVSGREF
jgi:hypothetical protein